MTQIFTAPPGKEGQVRMLFTLIAFMTVAIIFIMGMFFGRALAPTGVADPPETIDFAAAPEVEVTLPPGARVIDVFASADRVTLIVETPRGEQSAYTAPVTGLSDAARLRFVSDE